MTVSRPGYIAREAVKLALQLTSSNENSAVDLAISQASEKIDGQLRRKFYPTYDTRYFDQPNDQLASTGELWLDADEVVEITQLVSGGQVIQPANYFLYPNVPYNRIVLNQGLNSAFTSGTTYQNSIEITGTFGYTNTEVLATTLAEALNGSQTSVIVANGAAVGVSQLIRVGTERLIVKDKRFVDSTQVLEAQIDSTPSQNVLAVTDGTEFHIGEDILIGGEIMTISNIAGNNLIVKRSSTELESHNANSTIYVLRQLDLIRASTGTTAASATLGADVYLLTPPPLIQQLCLAEATTTFLQSDTGYARSLGSGSSDGKPSGAGLAELWNSANATFKRYLTGVI